MNQSLGNGIEPEARSLAMLSSRPRGIACSHSGNSLMIRGQKAPRCATFSLGTGSRTRPDTTSVTGGFLYLACDFNGLRGLDRHDRLAERAAFSGHERTVYMLLLYCPPTSNSAWVICPSEQTRTASISTANTFSSRITAWRSRSSIAGESLACLRWNSRRRLSWLFFSSSVERLGSSFCGAASPWGLRKGLTPTMGDGPSGFVWS